MSFKEVQVKKRTLLLISSIAIASVLAMPAYAAAPQPGSTGAKLDQAPRVFTVTAPTPAPTLVATAGKTADAAKPAAKAKAKKHKAKKHKAKKTARAGAGIWA